MSESIIYQFSVSDTRPRVEVSFTAPRDVTGAMLRESDCQFMLEDSDGNDVRAGGVASVRDVVERDGETSGKLVYTPVAGDFSYPGMYRGLFRVVYPDGGVESFPNGVPISFNVAPAIGER